MTAKRHHHGNLRAALIGAGFALLREGGIGSLTLRRAADRVGVSHAAPAHHFDGLAGLLTAIATEAFAQFSDAMLARRAATADEPFAQLAAICAGYLDFAAKNGALFQLMFTHPGLDRADPALAESAARAYGILREGCLPFGTAGQPDLELETAVWSLVHGYAALGFAAPDADHPAGCSPPRFEPQLRRLVMGRHDGGHS